MIAIKCTDGLYDESNKPYFISRSKDSKLKTNMPYVMHQADSMAARIEYEMWAKDDDTYTPPINQTPSKPKKAVSKQSQAVDVNKMFGDIIKVTPSSKIVGDMALYMITNDLSVEDVLNPKKEISFPTSVIEFFGIPP